MNNSREWTAEHQRELERIQLMAKLGLPNPHTGPFEKTAQCAKHQVMCDDCGEFAAKIIWKDSVRDSNTWFFENCDTCDHDFCEDCIMDNGDGTATCHTCFESALRRQGASK